MFALPSLKGRQTVGHERAALHRSVRALRRTRDQLEPMVHSGPRMRRSLAAALREPRSQSLWDQVRNTLDRLVDGGQRSKLLARDRIEA